MWSSRFWHQMKSNVPFLHDKSTPPIGLGWRSNTLFIVSTIAVGMFTDMFLYGLIVPVIPFMLQDRVHVPQEQIQTLTSVLLAVYAGASVLASPVVGVLADKFSKSRQLPFLLGLIMLALATVLLAVGRTVSILILARALQGASSGVVWTIGLALCLETVGPGNMGKTMGSIFSILSVGALFAPVLGGVLYEKTGYPGIFGLGVGFVVLDFMMRLSVIEKKIALEYVLNDEDCSSLPANGEPIDEEHAQQSTEETPLLGSPRSSSFSSGMSAFILPPTTSALTATLPVLSCLRNPSLLMAFLTGFVQATLLGAFESTVPTVASEYYSLDSLHVGLLMLTLGVSDLLLGPVAGWAIDRYGTKPGAIVGFVWLLPALVLLRLPQPDGGSQIALYATVLTLCGLGMAIINALGLVEAGIVMEKYNKANPARFGANGPYAQLYGLYGTVWSSGLTVGPLLAGGLKDAIGYGNMNAVLASICGVTGILSFYFLGGTPAFLRKD